MTTTQAKAQKTSGAFRMDCAIRTTMNEEFSGLMLPMIKGSLPDFAPIFEAYAADLKRAAEGGAS